MTLALFDFDQAVALQAQPDGLFLVATHPAYDAQVDKVMKAITDPKQMETYSTPDQIAEVVYEAATDGKDQLRYVAGADAKATYGARLQVGEEAFRKAIKQQFFG